MLPRIPRQSLGGRIGVPGRGSVVRRRQPRAAMTVVTLRAVERAQWPVVENLLQFYNYELSAWYPIPFGDDGRFAIPSKAGYLGQPGTQAWLILADGALAGMAIVDDEL